MHKIHSPLILNILVFISLLLTSASPASRLSRPARNSELNLQQPQISPPVLWQAAFPGDWFPLKPIQKPMSALLQATAFQAGRPAAPLTVGTYCTFPTLQDAVNAAGSHDEIHVEGKTWTGADATVDFPEKGLHIVGGYDSDCSDLVPNTRTILNANGLDNVFNYIVPSPTTKPDIYVSNFEITGGHSLLGGGVYTGNKVGWHFTNSIIHHNWSHYGGGIAMGSDTFLELRDTSVYTNTATFDGGGVYCQGTYTTTEVQIWEGSTIGNFAIIPGKPSHIKPLGNHADGSGGGVYLDNCTLFMNDAAVWYNNANLGGGIFAKNDSEVNLENSKLAINVNTAVYGGGIYLEGIRRIFFGAGQLSYNTASRNGGGLYATGISMYSNILSANCPLGQCTQISHNSAGDSGGGIYLANDPNYLTLDKVYLDSNHADGSASAIFATSGARMQIWNSMFIRGSAPDVMIQVDDTGGAPVIGIGDSTIADNTGNATAILGVDHDATLNGRNMIVWGNAGANLVAGDGTATITCSILQSAYTGGGNLVADPLFVNAAAGNYHIQVFSPAVDHCASGSYDDIDNQQRPYYSRAGSLTPYDAGADEVYTSILFMPYISK
jgi:predicted outer membrane repeat protein